MLFCSILTKTMKRVLFIEKKLAKYNMRRENEKLSKKYTQGEKLISRVECRNRQKEKEIRDFSLV